MNQMSLKHVVVALDTQTKIIHVDMNCFYAQVEMRDHPELVGKPVIISGPPNTRSVVGTANYEARKYKVHSGMPANQAYKLCPHGIFIGYDFKKYKKASNLMHQIFHRYTDIVEPLSLDEAFLDVTENKINCSSAIKIAKMIQNEILVEVGLTCSIGVSYNKFLAKVGSDFKKPYAITVILPKDAADFIKKLPIKDFPGVGKKAQQVAYKYAIYTGADLLEYQKHDLVKIFGKLGEILFDRVRGIDNRIVVSHREPKSIGAEVTFSDDLIKQSDIIHSLTLLAIEVENRISAKGYALKTVTLKVKYDDFNQITRSKTLNRYIYKQEDIMQYVRLLIEYVDLSKPIRLLGITGSQLIEKNAIKGEIRFEQIILDVFNHGVINATNKK